MRLISVVIQTKTGDANTVGFVFEHNGKTIDKCARISSLALSVMKCGDLTKEALYQIRKTTREAQRDFAYMEHGQNWRDHVGTYFGGQTTEDEKRIISSAVAILVGAMPNGGSKGRREVAPEAEDGGCSPSP